MESDRCVSQTIATGAGAISVVTGCVLWALAASVGVRRESRTGHLLAGEKGRL